MNSADAHFDIREEYSLLGKTPAMKTATAILSVVLFLTIGAWGSSYKVLYNFTGGTDGRNPYDASALKSGGSLNPKLSP